MEEVSVRVALTINRQVAILKLVRVAQLNAFDSEMHTAIGSCFDRIAGNPDIRAVIITGEGRAFSAGQDLEERASAFLSGELPDMHGSLGELYNPLVRRIAAMPVPIIAAVNGIAFGAGAAIAISCDIVLAAESAKFQFGFVNVGLGPDSGASWSLPRLVGLQRAMDLAMTGRAVTGPEAERIGLVARCVPDDRLLAEALEIAHQLATKSSPALSTIKARMRDASDLTLDQALDAERVAQAELGRTPDYRAAVLKFSKRT